MANTRELRRRIKSVKNTSQITKAMEMVAATKMRKAQNQALAGRPYTENLNFSLGKLTPKMDTEAHPLLNNNNSQKTGIILLTTDKALCGALNTNVLRALQGFIKEKKDVVFFTIGKKGRNFVAKTGKDLEADFDNLDIITFSQARQIGKLAKEIFLTKKVGEVYIVYPDFISTLRQEPKVTKLLPISESSLSEALTESKGKTSTGSVNIHGADEFLFEPSADYLLDFVLNHFIETKIYQALLETKASEHSARMIAMQNATKNAKELVEDLQLTYNQTRQSAITTELLEITSAGAAME